MSSGGGPAGVARAVSYANNYSVIRAEFQPQPARDHRTPSWTGARGESQGAPASRHQRGRNVLAPDDAGLIRRLLEQLCRDVEY